MWWRRRTVIALAGAALVAGCGFRPVYGTRDDAGGLAEDLRAIALPDAQSRLGYEVRQALANELNPTRTPTAGRYRLAYRLERSIDDLAVQLDAVVTRRNLTVGAVYALHDETDTVIYRGQVRRTASFNVRQEPYSDLVAEEDADRRAAHELAVAMRQQLVAYFDRRQPT